MRRFFLSIVAAALMFSPLSALALSPPTPVDMTSVNMELGSRIAGAQTTATVSFEAPVDWDPDYYITVTFPFGFDVTGVTDVEAPEGVGSFAFVGLSERALRLSPQDMPTAIPADTLVEGIVIHGVVNDPRPGATLDYAVGMSSPHFGVASGSGEGFFLSAPSVLVTAPNSGTFTAGEEVTVTWDADSPISSVYIEFQTSSDAEYMRVDRVPANPGLYMWTPTNAMATTTGKLRISGHNADGDFLSLDTGNFALTILVNEALDDEVVVDDEVIVDGDDPEAISEPVTFIHRSDDPANYAVPDLSLTSVRDDQVFARSDSAIFERLADEFTGRLIKTASSPTVYYYGQDYKRHPFPNEATYFSWYSGFDHILELTDTQMARIQLGSRVRMRAGTNLIKVQSNDDVYAVEADGMIHAIPDEETALSLFGADWNQRIVDVNPTFWTDYTVGSVLTDHLDGTLVRVGDDLAMLFDGRARRLTSAGLASNRFNEQFAITPNLTLDLEYYTNDISAREAALYNLPF